MSAIIFNNRRYNANSQSGGGSTPVADNDQVDFFTATLNQTIFTLSKTPTQPGNVEMFVNGQAQDYGSTKDFTVSGTTLTWLNRHFHLNNDEVEIEYDF